MIHWVYNIYDHACTGHPRAAFARPSGIKGDCVQTPAPIRNLGSPACQGTQLCYPRTIQIRCESTRSEGVKQAAGHVHMSGLLHMHGQTM